jgi:iron complex transport system permease protein
MADPACITASPYRTRWIFWFSLLGIGLVCFFLLDILLGSVRIPAGDVIRILSGREPSQPEWMSIVLRFRLPKAFTAVLTGMALSVSGLQMQTIFRNPLAGPYVLGITSGASLGVALLVMGMTSWLGIELVTAGASWAMVIAAWIGAGLILILILAVSGRVRDIMTILILGIMFGSATTALVSILQYFSSESALKAFIVWTLGSLGSVTDEQLRIMAVCVGAGLIMVLLSSKLLNVMLLGDDYARSMGVNIYLTRFIIFLSTSILAGTVTAFCGPIGFIGIAVPHIARMLLRTSNHGYLVPATMLTGAVLLLASDILAQLPGSAKILPINAVTALVGIPVVIVIVFRSNRLGTWL